MNEIIFIGNFASFELPLKSNEVNHQHYLYAEFPLLIRHYQGKHWYYVPMRWDTGTTYTLLPHPDDLRIKLQKVKEAPKPFPHKWCSKDLAAHKEIKICGNLDLYPTVLSSFKFAFPGYAWEFQATVGFRPSPKQRSKKLQNEISTRSSGIGSLAMGLLSLHDLLEYFDIDLSFKDAKRFLSLSHRSRDGVLKGKPLASIPEFKRYQ